MSMMLRLSSGSFTARSALRTVSGVCIAVGSFHPLVASRLSRKLAPFDQVLRTGVRDQPDGRVRDVRADQLQLLQRVTRLGIEGAVGEEDEIGRAHV